MTKRLYVFLLLFFIFILNLVFYYVSSDYRFFLKKIKYGEDAIIHVESKQLSDDYVIKNNLNIQTKDLKSSSIPDTKLSENYVLDEIDKEFIKYFSGYVDDKPINSESMLFSITEEYPDKYLYFTGKFINVYFFGVKSFDSMFDFFDVLSYDKGLNLKKIKLYGLKSFFINLDKSDGFVRIIMEYKNHIYGLKIKKFQYNYVKDKILTKITK